MAEQAAHAPSPWPEQISQQLWDSAPAPQQAPPTQEVMLPSPRFPSCSVQLRACFGSKAGPCLLQMDLVPHPLRHHTPDTPRQPCKLCCRASSCHAM